MTSNYAIRIEDKIRFLVQKRDKVVSNGGDLHEAAKLHDQAEILYWVLHVLQTSSEQCPNGLLPDGPICPKCGEKRGPSGVDGGSWIHVKR